MSDAPRVSSAKTSRIGGYWSAFLLSVPTAIVWACSFLFVFVVYPLLGDQLWWQQTVAALSSASPLAHGYRAKSSFPELSFQYFALMQPLSLLIFASGWWPIARHQDYKSIARRYEQGGVLLKTASWLILLSFLTGSLIIYTLLGGQELPGTRLNSSRLSLALFGPIAASGLAVFMSLWAINVALSYVRRR